MPCYTSASPAYCGGGWWNIAPIFKTAMNIHIALVPAMSLIAGILILVMPRLLNYVVAIYLILIGIVGLMH
jgi:hypothetical protein